MSRAEWFTLMYKDKYCGEVYLELTFFSNVSDFLACVIHCNLYFFDQEPPPEKKVTPKPTKTNKQYGGPGSFIPSADSPSSSANGSSSHTPASRIASMSSLQESAPDSFPESLRASSSLAKLDLYVPPYEQNTYRNHNSAIDHVTSDFGELDLSDHRRRESFPVRVRYENIHCTAYLTPLTAAVWRTNAAPDIGHKFCHCLWPSFAPV
jgi:neural Wiskott-Aldrich syndrome protein